MEKSLLKRLDDLRKTGSVIVELDSLQDGAWYVLISQNFGDEQFHFSEETLDLEDSICEGIKKLENARRRRTIKLY